MKKQIVVIHGGHPFDPEKNFLDTIKGLTLTVDDFKNRKSWRNSLADDLGQEFEVFVPTMPNKETARYEEWRIWFEKMLPFLNEEVLLVGHSLGGLFLAKYLSEGIFPKKIKALILVAAPSKSGKHNRNENFWFTGSVSKLDEQVKNIFLFYSKDDKIVPFSDAELYKAELPNAKIFSFEDKGHFRLEAFPELVELIKKQF